MMQTKIPLIGIHHIAIICSNYAISKQFYTEILGFEIIREVYRKERDSYKLDLSFQGIYYLELFSFSETPARLSRPEACGLRHLAFEVSNLDETVHILGQKGLPCEEIRVDEFTEKRFTFTSDPDHLPIEFYER
ncbi:VOC family protein [Aquirufa beregesia]|nr:VOC family protein [Aquirufa beregesia]